MQNAAGIVVPQHQFSDLPLFEGDWRIPKVRLALEMKGLIFGDNRDASFRYINAGIATTDERGSGKE